MLDEEQEILSPSERQKAQAEGYLEGRRKITEEENTKAQRAIEDAIIAGHMGRTGRKFPTREQNLQDALEWQAKKDAAAKAEAERIVRDTIAMQKAIKKAEEPKRTPPPTEKPPAQGVFQKAIGFARTVISRK